MKELKERIRQDGHVLDGGVLKVDSFLNHQIDVALLDAMAAEFARRFEGEPITKVLTIEASGIAIATEVARHLSVPLLFAKKSKTLNIDGSVFSTQVESFTHKCTYDVIVSRRFLHAEDRVLIVDDFLANGCALQGLIHLVEQAGAQVAGIGIAIEKGFQPGGAAVRELGYRLESLAIVDAMDALTGELTFRD